LASFIHEFIRIQNLLLQALKPQEKEFFSDIREISYKITSDLGYHETATLNKSLVILKSGDCEIESESGHESKVKKYT